MGQYCHMGKGTCNDPDKHLAALKNLCLKFANTRSPSSGKRGGGGRQNWRKTAPLATKEGRFVASAAGKLALVVTSSRQKQQSRAQFFPHGNT